jgi:Concanavalin A-like lectin/glucanases superfamily
MATTKPQSGTSNFTATTVITETIPLQGKVPSDTEPVGTMMFRIGNTDRNPGEASGTAEGFVVANANNGNAFQSINGQWCALGAGNIGGVDPTFIDRWYSTTPTYAQWGAFVVPAAPSITPSAVLHYTLNDNAANKTVVDATGHLNGQWTYQNTSASTTTGIIGSALMFDGTHDYITIPDTPYCAGPALTISLWVKNTSNNITWDRIVSKKTVYTDITGFEVTLAGSNSSVIYISGSSSTFATIDSGVNWPDNAWHHLVIIWDGDTTSLYVDGVFKGSGSIAPIVSNSNPLHFGKITSEASTMWQGPMDDIQIYDYAIAPDLATSLSSGANYINNEHGYSIGVTDRTLGEAANAPENFLVLNRTNGATFKVVNGVWT